MNLEILARMLAGGAQGYGQFQQQHKADQQQALENTLKQQLQAEQIKNYQSQEADRVSQRKIQEETAQAGTIKAYQDFMDKKANANDKAVEGLPTGDVPLDTASVGMVNDAGQQARLINHPELLKAYKAGNPLAALAVTTLQGASVPKAQAPQITLPGASMQEAPGFTSLRPTDAQAEKQAQTGKLNAETSRASENQAFQKTFESKLTSGWKPTETDWQILEMHGGPKAHESTVTTREGVGAGGPGVYTFDPRHPELGPTQVPGLKPMPPNVDPGVAGARADARDDKTYQQAKTDINALRTPVASQAERFDRAITSLRQRSPFADALIAPEILTAMAGGPNSGLRMQESELARISNGRSNWESLKAALNKWNLDPSQALSITDAQRQQMYAIAGEMQKKVGERLSAIDTAQQKIIDMDPLNRRQTVADLQKTLTGTLTGGQSYKVGDVVSDAQGVRHKITEVSPDGKKFKISPDVVK